MSTTSLNTKTTGVRLPDLLQLPLRPERVPSEGMFLQCEVMFGSPSSNCGGNGICKIVAKGQLPAFVFKRTSCSHAKALFASWDGGHGASMFFRRDWLCSNLMRRHFRHGILEMPEPCPVPPGLVSALGLKITELPAGLHLIEDYGTHYRINFGRTES